MSLRTYVTACTAVLMILVLGSLAGTTPPMTEDLHWMGRIVVQFSDEMGDIEINTTDGIALLGYPALDALARQYNVYRIEKLIPGSKEPDDPSIPDISRIYILEFPIEIDLHEVAQAYSNAPFVLTAEPYQIHKADYIPNDPYFEGQWALGKMNAELAYDYAQGSEDIIIGIVDSGTDTLHLDLKNNLWVNPGEDLNSNGVIDPEEWNLVDDDGNGYTDDFWGWNVWQGNYNIMDDNPTGGHGTHCAGDASAVTDNEIGISGLGWKAKIMSAKAGDGQFVYAAMAGVIYCVDNGANIISMSYGSGYYSSYEQTIMNNAWANGVLLFGSAGNESTSSPHYPSAYDNVISVAATNQYDQLASFSNFGTTVDICAPGVSIMSTTPGNTYYSWDGTSMSCPVAAGLGALIWSAKPEWSNAEVMDQIIATCVNIDSLNPGYAGMLGAGRIDAGAALSTLFPNLAFTELEFDDAAGNGDGRPDPGEDVDFLMTVENTSTTIPAIEVIVTLECDDPDITITQNTCTLVYIGTPGSANNHVNPFSFSVNPDAEPHEVTFTLSLEETVSGVSFSEDVIQMIGRPEIVLVDDDGGSGFETWYSDDLNSIGYQHDHWDVYNQGEITDSDLDLYPIAIWHTSNADDPISSEEEDRIATYLGNGGCLLLIGEDIDEQMSGTVFYSDVLHASSLGTTGSPQIWGIEGDPITAGDTLWMAGAGGAGNNSSPSTIDPVGDASLIFTYFLTGEGAGIRWTDDTGMLVYLPFNLEAASGANLPSGNPSTQRSEFLSEVIEWFESSSAVRPGPDNQIPNAFSLEQNYPNPFNPTTEIAFSLPTAGSTKLSVYDLSGRLVAHVINGSLKAGDHVVSFDASNLSSGIYLYRLEAEGFTSSRKMILLK